MRQTWPATSRDRGSLAAVLLLSLLLVLGSDPFVARSPDGGAAVRARAAAIPTTSGACAGEEHRQFDFWEGSWAVHAGDELAGRSEIRAVAGGCGLEETWRGTGGSRGTSLSYYDPADGRWHQLWVGSEGMILRLRGGLEDGRMVLGGERTADGERIRDRITWSRLAGGAVRQLWEVSRDDGQTWRTVFDGRYRRR